MSEFRLLFLRLQKKNILDKALEKLGITRHLDGKLIQAAIEIKRSRTEKRHRGKGLLDMIKTLENTKTGRLSIFSNKGGYFYNLADNQPEQVENYKNSIFGTLILWSLPLNGDTQ